MPTASSDCPICGVNEPHAHGSGDVESWVNALISRWGFEADVFAREGSRERLAGAWDKGHKAASADACQDGWRRTLNPYRAEQDEPHTPDAEPECTGGTRRYHRCDVSGCPKHDTPDAGPK